MMMTAEEREMLNEWPSESDGYKSQACAWRVIAGKLFGLPEAQYIDPGLPGIIRACRIIDMLVEKGKKNES